MLRSYLFFIGVGLLICGAWTAFLAFKQRRRSLHAIGQIAGSVSQTDQDRHTYYYARIMFVARDGTHVEFVSRVGSPQEPPPGQTLRVIYDADNPFDAAEDTFAAQWGLPLALCFLGAVSLAGALFSP